MKQLPKFLRIIITMGCGDTATLTLGRLRLKDGEFEISLGSIDSGSKKKKKKKSFMAVNARCH